MSITTIILSKDRPAQLDLLLRSIERNGGGQFVGGTITAYSPMTGVGWDTYSSFPWLPLRVALPGPFEDTVRGALEDAGEFVCFMCDDGILYRPLPYSAAHWLSIDPATLCFSLRLGKNTTVCYPSDKEQAWPGFDCELWPWVEQPQTPGDSDFGYPGSIDAHIFRTADVQLMLADKTFPNPTALECALVAGCQEVAAERPLMACYPHSVYVGNPINRVSEQSGVRFGQRFPVTAAECAERFARGERIDLDALDFSGVNGAHTEIELQWR